MHIRVTLRSAAAAIALTAAATGAQANDFFPGSGFPSDDPFTLSQAGASTSAGVGARNVGITGKNVSGTPTVSAGGFSVKDASDRFIAWCLDTLKNLELGTEYTLNNLNPFTTGPSLSTQQKDDIQDLFNFGYDTFLGSIDPDDNGVGSANNNQSAGFQVALWEIVNETGGTYDAGVGNPTTGFRTTDSTIAGIANDYLALIDPLSSTYTGIIGNNGLGYRVSYLESTGDPTRQNLVTVSPVPLPAAGVLMLAALGGLAGSRKLRRRAEA